MTETYTSHSKFNAILLPWVVCLSASLFFFYEFIQGNMFASVADNMMQSFQIEADGMAHLSSIYYLSNVIFLFVAGRILDKYSAKKTILMAMVLCVLSTFVLAHAHSFYLALFCRFVTGIGSAFCFLGPVRLASRWFPPKRMALITGVIVTMAMTGGMLAQYPLATRVALVGWRQAVMEVGWLGVGLLFIMILGIVEKTPTSVSSFYKKIDWQPVVKQIYFNPQILRAAWYTSLMNMAVAVYGAMMGTLYLIQRLGISKEQAAGVNSYLFFGAIIGGPLIGWCSDRLGLRILPMKIGAIASLISCLAILYANVSLFEMKALFFLLGFFTAAQVISYALVVESSAVTITATALSVISILTQGGYILYQNLFSFLLIRQHDAKIVAGVPIYSLADYQYATIILPLGLIIAFLMLIGLKETYCKHQEELC